MTTPIKSLLPESKSPNTDSTLLLIGHLLTNRSVETDEILSKMCIYDHHLIACAADSILYSDPRGISGNWDNHLIEELWEYALPYSIYENGDSFEKLVISNAEDIYAYVFQIYHHYRTYLYNSIINSGHVTVIENLAKYGAVIYTGINFSLINIGRSNDQLFITYDVAPTFPFPIRPRSST